MNWVTEAEKRIRKKNQVLFAKDDEFLADLAALIQTQKHRALVLWAFELADETVQYLLTRRPNEQRLAEAVLTCRQWACGTVKMPVAQQAILRAHAAARETASLEELALCHAVGQACSVVHASGHAMGYPVYELTALVRMYGLPACREPVEQRKQIYLDRIRYWQDHYEDYPSTWAKFMLAD